MDEEGLQTRLATTIANIEERTDTELVDVLTETLLLVASGLQIESVNDQYKTIYRELSVRYALQQQNNPNPFKDLWAFHDYWKENELTTYASRRSFARKLYENNDKNDDDKWSGINPVIASVARPRFESRHFSDAVEASFKEINSRIKETVRQKTNNTYDGASLMNHAFSADSPVIILEDLETEDGLNIQRGYMQIFAGAMTAIRNPKAHSNIEIEEHEAMPLIHLASLLFTKYEAAVGRDVVSKDTKTVEANEKTLYLRIENPNDNKKLTELKRLTSASTGSIPVVLVIGTTSESAIKLAFGVDGNAKLVNELKLLMGDKNVVLK